MRKIYPLIIVLFFCAGVFAESLEDKQQELQAINQELLHQQQLLQQTRQKERASLRDLFLINRKISRVKGDLNYNQKRLALHNQSIQQTHSELQKTRTEYQTRQSLFARRIGEIYKSQNLGYLALFFSNRSFSDIINSSYYYRKIIESDLANMQHLVSLRRDISQKESVLEYQKKIIEQTHKSIQQQKQLYEIQAHQQQNIYVSLRAQRQEYEHKVEELLRNSKEIETMIKKLMSESRMEARGSGSFIWPVRGIITSYYGNRRHPIFKIIRFHTGIDISANLGTPVKTADSGIVIFSGWWGGYGRAVIINHGHGFSTVYGHLSRSYVHKGQKIDKYEVLGLSGSTGYSTGPHLHFEVRKNGETQDPMKFLP